MKRIPHERVVCALFENREEAHHALDALAATEIPSEDISVITNQMAYEQEEFSEFVGNPLHDESVHAAKIGGVVGFLLAGIVGMLGFWMSGTAIVAAAPLMFVIASVGGLLGALIQVGFEETHALKIDEAMREGKILMAVHSRNHAQASRAEGILRECHAQAVHHY